MLDEGEGKCVICSGQTRYISFTSGFKFTCSKPCENEYKKRRTIEALIVKYGVTNASQLPDHDKKTRATKLERYGDETYVNPDKLKVTCLERYGSISYTGTEGYNESYRATVLAKYGVEHTSQSEIVKQKICETSMSTYGVDHPLKSPEVRARITATNEALYGGTLMGSHIIAQKCRDTMIELYGVASPQQSPEIREQTKLTNIEKYGFEYPIQNPDVLHRALSSQSHSYSLKQYQLASGDIVHYQSEPELKFIVSCEARDIDVDDGPSLPYIHNGKLRTYHVDFIVTEGGTKRLIEVKQKHGWWRREKVSKVAREKARAAQAYSCSMGYAPFKVVFIP